MKVLIIGSGGREHALAWKASQSPGVETVFVAPGNAGTETEPGVLNVPIAATDIEQLADFARRQSVDLTIVGPEAPLVAGVSDRFQEQGLRCFGPSRDGARLEGSKAFSKRFLRKHGIPTAHYADFIRLEDAVRHLDDVNWPVVIKADGLAQGKGVVIAEDHGTAVSAVTEMMSGEAFGEAGLRVVIEEFLEGEEASIMCLVGGEDFLLMSSSQDHKAAYNGDTGPNTGGMGAYSPAPVVDQDMLEGIVRQVIRPTLKGLHDEGIEYYGFLYAGLMIGQDRIPRVLEFNCRLGDPETQPILMRLESDLVGHCIAALEGTLAREQAIWSRRSALGVVMAAEGYPQHYETGRKIEGLPRAGSSTVKVFHAGTRRQGDSILTAGGRVLCVTALGDGVAAAHDAAYSVARTVRWDGSWYRDDIGHRAIDRDSCPVPPDSETGPMQR